MKKPMLGRAFVLLLSLFPIACRSPESVVVTSTQAELASAERMERRRLAMAGFERLDALASRDFEVQRVDPMWDLIDYPSVEVTRDPSGVVSVSMNYLGHRVGQDVPIEVWRRLVDSANGAFVEPDPRAVRRRDREVIRRSGYCHSWHELEAVLAGTERRITATPCYGDLQARSLAYAEAVARVGIDHIRICEPDRQISDIGEALYACGRRFGPPTAEYRAITTNRL